MSVTISPAYLLDAATGEPHAAEVWDAITERQLAGEQVMKQRSDITKVIISFCKNAN